MSHETVGLNHYYRGKVLLKALLAHSRYFNSFGDLLNFVAWVDVDTSASRSNVFLVRCEFNIYFSEKMLRESFRDG
ncbi:hypothetical protein M7I_1895 [Glarea lozoyensis 74030]|uniref:Uncharacterized protein n=1 Tax=Glarea lozoyensis (strain ATCC 74030 / MF5533) TaxID=1104152 RepID=H0EHB8_GLAL7|nr:hypothetical protein M7I_1895 [Glarea lozoyensis 74030]